IRKREIRVPSGIEFLEAIGTVWKGYTNPCVLVVDDVIVREPPHHGPVESPCRKHEFNDDRAAEILLRTTNEDARRVRRIRRLRRNCAVRRPVVDIRRPAHQILFLDITGLGEIEIGRCVVRRHESMRLRCRGNWTRYLWQWCRADGEERCGKQCKHGALLIKWWSAYTGVGKFEIARFP